MLLKTSYDFRYTVGCAYATTCKWIEFCIGEDWNCGPLLYSAVSNIFHQYLHLPFCGMYTLVDMLQCRGRAALRVKAGKCHCYRAGGRSKVYYQNPFTTILFPLTESGWIVSIFILEKPELFRGLLGISKPPNPYPPPNESIMAIEALYGTEHLWHSHGVDGEYSERPKHEERFKCIYSSHGSNNLGETKGN